MIRVTLHDVWRNTAKAASWHTTLIAQAYRVFISSNIQIEFESSKVALDVFYSHNTVLEPS